MVNQVKSIFKSWFGPAVVLIILVLGLGIGLTRAQQAVEPAPTDTSLRATKEISGRVAAEGLIQTGVTLQDVNRPANSPGVGNAPLPKFSGLNARGPILNGEAGKPLMFFDDAMIYGLTDARNGIVNSAAPGGVATPLTIYDNLKIAGAGAAEPGNLTVGGSIQNANADLKIDDGLDVTGNIQNSAGDLKINDDISLFNYGSDNNIFRIYKGADTNSDRFFWLHEPQVGVLDLNGSYNTLSLFNGALSLHPVDANTMRMSIDQPELYIESPTLTVGQRTASFTDVLTTIWGLGKFMTGLQVFAGNLEVTNGNTTLGTTTIGSGAVGAATNKNLTVNGNATITGTLGTTTIGTAASKKDLTVNGKTTISGNAAGDHSLLVNGAGARVAGNFFAGVINSEGALFVSDTLWAQGDINLNGGKLYTTNKNDFNPVVIEDPLTVNGHVRSTGGFGTYSRVASAVITLAAGGVSSVAATCPAGTTLISCTPTTDSGSTFSSGSYTQYVQIMSLYPDLGTRSCTMWGKNTAVAADRYFGVYAICLNPNS